MNSQMVIEGIVPEDYTPEQQHNESAETPVKISGDDQTLSLPLDLGRAA